MKVIAQSISDFLCPWCYLAFGQLKQAKDVIETAFPDVSVEINVLPHLLRPKMLETPNKIIDKEKMYTEKVGNKGKLISIKSELTHLFSMVGLEYSIKGEVGHTLHAHRLMKYLQDEKKLPIDELNQVASNIFYQYHTKGKALNQVEPLIEACKGVFEVDEENLTSFILSKDLTEETLADITEIPKQSEYKFTKGVPHILIKAGDMSHVVPGAQDSGDYFVRLFKKMIEKNSPKL